VPIPAAAVATGVVLALAWGISAAQEKPSPPPDAIWIYKGVPEGKDTRSETEVLFAPFGYMPASRADQISVNPSTPVDRKDSQGTCIEYLFKFEKRDDWVGAYTLINGTSWGTKPGINVQKLLGVGPETKLALRFKARGEGAVSFKIGGVTNGLHKSSLTLARQVDNSPTKLTGDFCEYTIGPIEAQKLTNLIDPFCVVTSALDNPGRDLVKVYVDDIRLELFDRPKQAEGLPEGWRSRLLETFWVCYTPTGFDPTAKPIRKPTAEDIREDLRAIRALADRAGIAGDRVGIVLYGCSGGLEDIAPLAREAKLSAVLGIFNPRDAGEVENAEALLRRKDLQETILACCVGNEAITFRRSTLEDIQKVAKRLSQVRRVPTTTTEIVQAYGDPRLFSFDFTLVNAHALFADIYDPDQAAKWAVDRVKDLRDAAPKGHLILVKEFGWPGGPKPFSDEQQAAYWKAVLGDPVARQVNVCIFDGLHNVPWKKETITVPGGEKVNVGPHWPVLFAADRKPKPFADGLLRLWKKTRER
jgi:exo-beta-1,3-glucanase (GH17 family)